MLSLKEIVDPDITKLKILYAIVEFSVRGCSGATNQECSKLESEEEVIL